MQASRLALVALVAFGAWACSGEGGSPSAGASSSSSSSGGDEDERGSVGPAHPSYAYCTRRGGTIDTAKDLCVFPDGTACPPMDFWNGVCGQAHSYCEEHGGRLARKERDMGGWTAVVAVCTLGGRECDEQQFLETSQCGP